MELIHEVCCGVDVHKKEIVACLLISSPNGRIMKKEIRKYRTFTEELVQFCGWLKESGCNHVAMESTGIYWKPIFNVLEEEGMNVCLVNARHMKNVPGRKTDVKDCEWITNLFRQGLVRPSLIPDRDMRECRELIRRRKRLIQNRTSEKNRLQKILEDANIKLNSVASDVFGASGIRMLNAIVSGVTDPEVLSELAQGTLRNKIPQLKMALMGRIGDHHVLMIRQILMHIQFLDDQISQLSHEISIRLNDHTDDIDRLMTIPGVKKKSAETIFIEIGGNVDNFKTSQHLSSWAGVCPGNNQSAGKRMSGRNTRGNRWLREVLMECAQAARSTHGTFLRARYEKISIRRGVKRGTFAIAHRILEIAYDILKNKTLYHELGDNYYQNLNREKQTKYYLKKLKELGVSILLTEA